MFVARGLLSKIGSGSERDKHCVLLNENEKYRQVNKWIRIYEQVVIEVEVFHFQDIVARMVSSFLEGA